MRKFAIILALFSVLVFTAAKVKNYKVINNHKHDDYKPHSHDYRGDIDYLLEHIPEKNIKIELLQEWHATDPHQDVKLRPLNFAYQGGSGDPKGAQRVDTWSNGQADHQHGEFQRHTHEYGEKFDVLRTYTHEHRESVGNGETRVIHNSHTHSLDNVGRSGDWYIEYHTVEFQGQTQQIPGGGHQHGKQPGDDVFKRPWTVEKYQYHHSQDSHDGVKKVSEILPTASSVSVSGNVLLSKKHQGDHPLLDPRRDVWYLHTRHVATSNPTTNTLYYVINQVHEKEKWASRIDRFDSVGKKGREKAEDTIEAMKNHSSTSGWEFVEGEPPQYSGFTVR